MNTTENNQLIAEFEKVVFHDDENQYYNADGLHIGDTLLYHTSWDWLMPVVVECFDRQEEVSDDLSFKLNDTLLETNIESLYKIVVEFINQLNK
tara:strand:+ start:2120 stop:2401 length:282 start_codon:yes stop_codon:yes gene_type:complete